MITRNPTREEVDELVSYLPIFSQEGYDPVREWRGGESLTDGTHTFPWPIYREEVGEFFRLAGGEPWSDYGYQDKNPAAMLRDPRTIDNATLDQIKTMLTYFVRGERFGDGFWGEMIREGLIQRLLERLVMILKEY
jgi:hypothetical protein